ncbi:hypothetical protein ACN42_g272 [Penicillium freii]|uniref:Uncharacterized protein n=1 Tax=Penicillium freii TaxID=48697 RepID=A0A117NST5_PENFR|nr:hypothetical protein ACN42_g272 [Penicillium freii]
MISRFLIITELQVGEASSASSGKHIQNSKLGHRHSWRTFRSNGLLQQFQHVTPEDDDDEPTGLAAMDLAKVDQHANQLAMTTSPSIETEAGGRGCLQRERSERDGRWRVRSTTIIM